jgi:hypothetical protein
MRRTPPGSRRRPSPRQPRVAHRGLQSGGGDTSRRCSPRTVPAARRARSSCGVLSQNLKRWFKRQTVPIWVTEYGHETKPPDTVGISYAKQAAYIKQSIAIAKTYPFVTMFIWFVYQDDQGQPWDSGVYDRAGAPKGSSPPKFSAAARPLDARHPIYEFKRGTVTPLLTLYTRRYCVGDPAGTAIGRRGWPAVLGAPVRLRDHRPTAGVHGRPEYVVPGDICAQRHQRHDADAAGDDARRLELVHEIDDARSHVRRVGSTKTEVTPTLTARRG